MLRKEFADAGIFWRLHSYSEGEVMNLKSAQQAVISTLLGHIFSLGLISQFTYSKAEDLVYSGTDFPDLFRLPVCLTEARCQHECAQDP